MNIITLLSTKSSAFHRICGRELAAIGVEFIVEGSESLRGWAKDNQSYFQGANEQPVVGSPVNKQSGRYRSDAVPK